MKEDAQIETELRKYLLNELTEDERTQVEERLFLDSDYFQQLQAEEDDLIDEYTYNELSPEEMKSFRSYVLSNPARNTDIRIAKALKHYVAQNAGPEPFVLEDSQSKDVARSIPQSMPFWASLRAAPFALRFSLSLAAVLIITLGGIWLIYKAQRQANPSNQAQVPQPPAEQNEQHNLNRDDVRGVEQNAQNQSNTTVTKGGRDTTGANLEANRSTGAPQLPRSPAHIYSFFLIPGGISRDGGATAPTTVHLPREADDVVKLQMPLITETSYTNFRAILVNQTGAMVKQWSRLKSAPYKSLRIVSVKIPAHLMESQRYSVELSGVAPNGDTEVLSNYLFQVTK